MDIKTQVTTTPRRRFLIKYKVILHLTILTFPGNFDTKIELIRVITQTQRLVNYLSVSKFSIFTDGVEGSCTSV